MLDPDLRNYGSRYRQVEFRPVATTEAAESYRRFGATLVSARGELGTLAASMGVIAIAPYTIRRAEWLEMRAPAQGAVALDRLDTLLLFDHPLSCPEAETALLDARMPHVFIVPGTRIVVATRRALDRLPSFAPLLQPIGKPARLCGRREPLRG
jgi:hypothetical protein